MANGRIRFGKQSGGEVVLVFPDGVDNTEVLLPESGGGLATKDYVDATLVGLGGLSVSDKTKLDGIEEQATKNETDGFLLDRSNHTGSIPISVVENLEQELANISTGGSGGLTPDELLRIEELESGIVKKADLDSEGKILTSQLPVIPTSLPDADSDGKLYGRMDGVWTEIVSVGGGTNAEIVAITNKLDAKGVEANKVLVSNGDDTSEWKDYNTYSYTESEIAPLNPKLGDDWRDTASGKLYKWSSVGGVAEWSEIGSGSSSGVFNPDNDIILSAGKGVVMTSGNGTVYKLYIDNDGRLTTEVM